VAHADTSYLQNNKYRLPFIITMHHTQTESRTLLAGKGRDKKSFKQCSVTANNAQRATDTYDHWW